MKSLKVVLFALSVLVIPVTADAKSTLYDAACEYRDAVRHFERAVNDVRIDRYDSRLVDRLEDATSDLRSRSRHPQELDRLSYAWDEVRSLHARVESAIFERSFYAGHPILVKCWSRVTCAYQDLAIEMNRVCHSYETFGPGPYGRSFRPPVGHNPYGPPVTAPRFTAPQVLAPRYSAPEVFTPPATVPFGNPNQFSPSITPGLSPPTIDEVRYRQWTRSPTSRVDNRYRGHDVRSAMVGAMLSRLLD